MIDPRKFTKDELFDLIVDSAKNWLAHDGLWFLAAEEKYGMEAAIELDREAWRKFTVIEAKRIMNRLGMQPGGGIPALITALDYRLYAYINEQKVEEVSEDRCVFKMKKCRVQTARKRKNLPDFPCKSVGIVEYRYFAETIDPRINTKCLTCPPDDHPEDYYCAWEFSI
ncbi:hypothetical protein GF337_16190 [candidate division KSB1 bacterium]|nr:hypothetical protein [candidate division KSB1 bacterium]